MDASQGGEGSQPELPTHTEDGREILYDDPEYPDGYVLEPEEETPPAPTPAPVVRTQPMATAAPVVQPQQTQQQAVTLIAPPAFDAVAYLNLHKDRLNELAMMDPTAHFTEVSGVEKKAQRASDAITSFRQRELTSEMPQFVQEYGTDRIQEAYNNLQPEQRRDESADLYAMQYVEGNEILRLRQSGMSKKDAAIAAKEKSLAALKGTKSAPAPVATKPRVPNPAAPRVPSGGGVAAPSRSSGGGTPRGTQDSAIRAYMETYGMSYEEAKALRANWGNQH